MKETDEITYDQAAEFLDCSSGHVRRVIRRLGIEPIRKGHRTVRLKAGEIFRLKLRLAMLMPKRRITVGGWKYKLMHLAPSRKTNAKGKK
jgi:excisionase family DNA binding protein